MLHKILNGYVSNVQKVVTPLIPNVIVCLIYAYYPAYYVIGSGKGIGVDFEFKKFPMEFPCISCTKNKIFVKNYK